MLEVASVHVPKTAGTALRGLLESWYTRVAIHYPEQGRTWSTHYPRLSGMPDVVHGHLPASQMPRARTTIAVVREPVERLRSLYAYWSVQPLSRVEPHPVHRQVLLGMSFEEFVRAPKLANEQSRYVDGPVDVVLQHERLGDHLPRLAARLDQPMLPLAVRNVTEAAKPAATRQMRRVAARLHADDVLLWRSAGR